MSAPAQLDANLLHQVVGPAPGPLHKAIADGDVGAMHRAIANGEDPAEPNHGGINALHIACLLGRAEIAKALIALNSELLHSVHAATESRPLHFACQQPYTDVVAVLLEAGADPCIKDDQGTTSLHFSACTRNAKAVKLLLAKEKGAAFLDAMDSVNGATALMHAFIAKDLEIMRILLAAGASPNVHMPDGPTLLYRAAKGGIAEVVRVLLQGGADVDERTSVGTTESKPHRFLTVEQEMELRKWISDQAGAATHSDIINKVRTTWKADFFTDTDKEIDDRAAQKRANNWVYAFLKRGDKVKPQQQTP